jgi:hypothetical protein
MHKRNKRYSLAEELKGQLSELGRSKPYRDASNDFTQLIALLIGSAERERAGLDGAMHGLLNAAEVIPLDTDLFHRASGIQSAFDMSLQDSLVLASVVQHLANAQPPQSCFLNRNTKDFGNPDVRGVLDDLDCKFFGRFDHALGYIESWLRRSGQNTRT